MIKKLLPVAIAAAFAAGSVHAAGFINGGFDDGTTNGWIVGGGSRSGQNLSTLNPTDYLPGGSRYNATIASTHSAVVSPGNDVRLGTLLPNVVYGPPNSYRVEESGVVGGFVSVISQTVTNYTDPNIFFAWLAALENGGHTRQQSAAMIIKLEDITAPAAPVTLISRIYDAGGGTDARFSNSGSGNYFYTPQWQIEQLAIDATLTGHDFRLTVLASDCAPTGHSGYVYLDGFGSVTPPVNGGTVPEPGTALLAGVGLLGLVAARRRKQV